MAFDHQYIEENRIAERYLRRTLSREDRANFEAHFPDCPDCQDRLALAEVFRGQAGEPVTGQPTRSDAGLLPSLLRAWNLASQRQRQITLALATAALAGIPLVFVAGVYFGLASIQNEARHTSMLIDPGPSFGVESYTVAVTNSAGRIISATAGLEVKPGQLLSVPLNYAQLPAGDYTLSIRARRIDGQLDVIARYPFRNRPN